MMVLLMIGYRSPRVDLDSTSLPVHITVGRYNIEGHIIPYFLYMNELMVVEDYLLLIFADISYISLPYF